MKQLHFEPTYRCTLRPLEQLEILLVGCGGTGSHVAQAIGATLWHLQQRGDVAVKATFIDGDLVEEKNVGRQRFCSAEIGRNKAETLAWRLNAAYGLDIAAFPQFISTERYREQFPFTYGENRDRRLVIGCVDNAIGRRVLSYAVEQGYGRVWWLDCGNAAFNGQVLIGNCGASKAIRPPEPDFGLWHDLPAPHVQEPGLLDTDNDPAPNATCAVAVQTEEQSLMVNTLVASVAAQFLYGWMVQRELTSYATYLNGQPPVMASRSLTRSNLLRFVTAENDEAEETT